MRIQHNVMAMNAYRNYSNNTSALSKNLEKLSSGYKINRAGDDAAGLAISEKMRAQITGLGVAQKNAKDGISLVQTAEGALTEVHDMLNRMVELASQSANGTYDNETDRANLQKEMDQLLDEIDRIADSSNFNGINLLDGTMESGADATKVSQFTVGGTLPGVGETLGTDTVLNKTPATGADKTSFSIDLHDYTFSNANGETLTIDLGGKATLTLDGDDGGVLTGAALATAIQGENATVTIDGAVFEITDGGKGRLNFVQQDTAADSAYVDGDMKVSISGAGTAAVTGEKAVYEVDLTGMVAGDSGITIDGQAVTWTTDLSTTLNDFVTAYNGAGKDYTASVSGNKIVLTANAEGAIATDPTVSGNVDQSGANTAVTITETTEGADAAPAGSASGAGDYNVSTTNVVNAVEPGDKRLASTVLQLTSGMVSNGSSITIGKETYTFTTDATQTGAGYVNIADLDSTDADFLSTVAERLTAAAAGNTTYTVGHNGDTNGRITLTEIEGQTNFVKADGTTSSLDTVEGIEESLSFSGPQVTGSGLVLQIGDTSDSWNQLTVDIQDMHVDSLGIKGLDISEQGNAQDAIDKIKAAINTVSSVRGTLGATQNRLDHTINNLSVMEENIQDAESTIRDTDVAEEMMEYTKNNILIQSAQAMLAQANQVPQGVLQLLQ